MFPSQVKGDLRSRVCFTVDEVAALLGVPVGEIRKNCQRGTLKARRFSVGYRISPAALDAFLLGVSGNFEKSNIFSPFSEK